MTKNENNLDAVQFEVKWTGKPHGLIERLLTKIHLNFTDYEITKDELIIKKGFFKQVTNTTELYLLKDPDLTVNLYQRIIGVGTISVLVDTHCGSNKAGQRIVLRNIQDSEKVRKLLRDSIEADVMERKITYFDKV
jgi:uncharacterized membrane protein YdbT with pleckstrin-like domain